MKEHFYQVLINTGPHSRSVHGIVLEYASMGSLQSVLDKKVKGLKEKVGRRVFRKLVEAV
jgi:hypothetical protein